MEWNNKNKSNTITSSSGNTWKKTRTGYSGSNGNNWSKVGSRGWVSSSGETITRVSKNSWISSTGTTYYKRGRTIQGSDGSQHYSMFDDDDE